MHVSRYHAIARFRRPRIFGAVTLRQDIVLHTFHPTELWSDLDANFRPYGIECRPYVSEERVTFSYLFPLGKPEQSPASIKKRLEQVISGRDVLSFGCVEGDFVVHSNAAVFDPQGGKSRGFHAAGSRANRLAIVLNRQELIGLTKQSAISDAVTDLLTTERANVVVVKDGPKGALVFTGSAEPKWVPAYDSANLYKIGSGDIFSAVFAHEWLTGKDPAEAADLASRILRLTLNRRLFHCIPCFQARSRAAS